MMPGVLAMILLALTFLTLGGLLARRYRVFILIPATFLGVAAIFAAMPLLGLSLGAAVLAAAILATSLQMGFLAGAALLGRRASVVKRRFVTVR